MSPVKRSCFLKAHRFKKRQHRKHRVTIGAPVGSEVCVRSLWSLWSLLPAAQCNQCGKQTNTVAVVVMASLWWTNIARWRPPNFLAGITGYSLILPV